MQEIQKELSTWIKTSPRQDTSQKCYCPPRNGWKQCRCLQWQKFQQRRNQIRYDWTLPRRILNHLQTHPPR